MGGWEPGRLGGWTLPRRWSPPRLRARLMSSRLIQPQGMAVMPIELVEFRLVRKLYPETVFWFMGLEKRFQQKVENRWEVGQLCWEREGTGMALHFSRVSAAASSTPPAVTSLWLGEEELYLLRNE